MDGKQKSVAAITQELQNCSEEALIALCSNLRTDPRKSVQLLAEKAMKRLEKEKKELERVQGMIDFEREIAGSTIYCGIDEAGRGPLAGPVVAAAVIMPRDGKIPYVNDSKQVSEKKREQLYADYVAGVVDSEDYQLIREDYSKQYDGLRAALQRAEAKKMEVEQQIREYLNMTSNLEAHLDDFGFDAQLVKSLVQRIEVSADKRIRIVFGFQDVFADLGKESAGK